MLQNHEDEIERLIYLNVSDKNCFSRNQHEFLEHEKIADTDIFVDLNLTKMDIIPLCKDILTFYGYKESDFSIETT